jgi:hypothetical protein
MRYRSDGYYPPLLIRDLSAVVARGDFFAGVARHPALAWLHVCARLDPNVDPFCHELSSDYANWERSWQCQIRRLVARDV